jgi:predicted phosphodiesterase
MRLQILSDLHLEFYGLTKLLRLLRWIPVRGNVLVLAGDIGNPYKLEYRTFFDWASVNFEHVVYVPGNHEYYFHTIPETHARIQNVLGALANVHVLNGASVEINGVRFVGATLWTNIVDPHKLVADAERIHGWSVESNNELHQSHRREIARELAEPSTTTTVVVTHHLPSWNCLRISSPYNQCFASESDDLVQNCALWIHGHSHFPSDEVVRDVRVVCNPIGHPGERMDPDFAFCVDV